VASDSFTVANETWGLSGPTFLVVYAALAAAVGLLLLSMRRRLVRDGSRGAVEDVELDRYRLALLNEGDVLAVTAAATELRAHGLIRTDGESEIVRAVQASSTELQPLEKAVLAQLRISPTASADELAETPAAASVLAGLRAELVERGLLLREEDRDRFRRHAVWVVALIALGIVRVAAGVANDKPVGFLVVSIGGLAFVALPWSLRAPRASRSGLELLAAARRRALALKGPLGPHDPRLGLALALFGLETLWTADETFAAALGLPRAGVGGSGGGCGGGGCGGCGG